MALPQYTPEQREPQDPLAEEKERLHKAVKHIPVRVGIHAGKGGVGKTFLATQLAMALARSGRTVGLIDADVDCPNVPDALGLRTDLRIADDGRLVPAEHNGVKVVSTGFMQGDEPIIIRGPIKHRLLTDFVEKTEWGELDVLLYDFPPGTSDVPLSAMQVASLTGIILITTPSPSALSDCKRAAQMAQRMETPILGFVENMTGEIFGAGTADAIARKFDATVLARIPLDAGIRQQADEGRFALEDVDLSALISAMEDG